MLTNVSTMVMSADGESKHNDNGGYRGMAYDNDDTRTSMTTQGQGP